MGPRRAAVSFERAPDLAAVRVAIKRYYHGQYRLIIQRGLLLIPAASAIAAPSTT